MGGNAKIEFIARITDEDGHIIERTVSATHGFASFDDFDMSTKAGFLSDFGVLEEAILEARNRAGQEITADFLELASKKKEKADRRLTAVESEIGRIPLHIGGNFAKELKPKERILTKAFMDVAARICVNLSFRDSVATLNRLLRRNDSDTVKLRSLSNSMLRIGEEISQTLSTATEKVLLMYGFNQDTGLPDSILPARIKTPKDVKDTEMTQEVICSTVESINAARDEKIPQMAQNIQIEKQPDTCVYISIDDVGVKRQKEERKEGTVRNSKYVENTVAHIQYGKNVYVLTAVGMDKLFKSVLAFLLTNDLFQYELVFFTDGAMNIKNYINRIFGFHPYIQILDWYHLKKKCMELLSMAIAGKDKRNSVLEKLLRFLWVGDMNEAKNYLDSLSPPYVKSQKWLNETIAYLKRKEDCIPCYAVRAKLGLRISSNPVEKANDILVAQRQKHNGMAWSPKGSGALASIEMIYRNSQEDLWFKERQLLGFPSSYSFEAQCA